MTVTAPPTSPQPATPRPTSGGASEAPPRSPAADTPQLIQPSVRARLAPGTATEVRISARDHRFTVDEPTDLGGSDLGATPVEHLLAALGACQVITFQLWADKLGIALDEVDVQLDGDIDLRGFFGLSPEVRPGFQGLRVSVTLGGPESRERYEELVSVVDAHCPVLDNLRATVPVDTVVAFA